MAKAQEAKKQTKEEKIESITQTIRYEIEYWDKMKEEVREEFITRVTEKTVGDAISWLAEKTIRYELIPAKMLKNAINVSIEKFVEEARKWIEGSQRDILRGDIGGTSTDMFSNVVELQVTRETLIFISHDLMPLVKWAEKGLAGLG